MRAVLLVGVLFRCFFPSPGDELEYFLGESNQLELEVRNTVCKQKHEKNILELSKNWMGITRKWKIKCRRLEWPSVFLFTAPLDSYLCDFIGIL